MKRYLVGGGGGRGTFCGWFSALRTPGHWSNYVVCKTFAHALAQFKRLPVKYRQIDLRGDGRPRCILYGKFRRQG